MKKILFASTALIATAGVAAADVSFGGYGRFGVAYNEANTGTVSSTVIVSRLRLNIDGSAETDGGVRFSARVRIQADDNLTAGTANVAALNGARFSVEYEGLRVDVGNVAGALDNMPGYYGEEPGLENFLGQYSGVDYDFTEYTTGGAGANGVYARYAMGDFAFAASYDDNNATAGDRWDIYGAYTFGNITGALAYGETDATTTEIKQDILVLTLAGSWGAFNGTLFVGNETVDDGANAEDTFRSDTFYGLSAGYAISSATTIVASYGDGSGDRDTEQYGLGVIHDLGGGVSLRGGVGSTKSYDTTSASMVSNTRADFGARFNF